jgi:hypothetical protein
LACLRVAAAPFPLRAWQIAELRIIDGLVLRRDGRESDLAGIAAANAAALETYPEPATRGYLKSQIRSALARPVRLSRPTLTAAEASRRALAYGRS